MDMDLYTSYVTSAVIFLVTDMDFSLKKLCHKYLICPTMNVCRKYLVVGKF